MVVGMQVRQLLGVRGESIGLLQALLVYRWSYCAVFAVCVSQFCCIAV